MFEHEKNPPAPTQSTEIRESYDTRQNRVLKAATGVIARVGYERATMRAVAKAANVSLAGLYHYFDNKEKILFLIQHRTFSSLVGGLREKLHGVSDPVKQLHIMVRSHVSYFAEHMAALKACSHELDTLTGEASVEARRLHREYYDITRDIVDRIIATRPDAKELNQHIATMLLFSMLNWLYRWYDPQRGSSPTTITNQIVKQYLQGLLGESNRAN